VQLLQKKTIWCLNIGETYNISAHCWRYFCDALHLTNVTNLYVSEHVISKELKHDMRYHIRENRKKHDLHCAFKYIRVIKRMTNCWWYVCDTPYTPRSLRHSPHSATFLQQT
jgi:hypothetical protein